MKKILIIPLLILLTGCVTYYQPETALEDGVYYAEDDPKYVVYQDPYPYGVYYPWVSLDYFYLGFNPYPRYPYFYGFPYGLHYGYAYWYYPDWRRYHGYCSHYGGCGRWRGHDGPGNGSNRHAGNGNGGHRNRDDENADNEDTPVDSLERPENSGGMYGVPYGQYISAAPSGYSGNRGMVIRSSENKKVGKSRVQPSDVSEFSNGIVISAQPSQPSSPSVSRPPSASMPGSSSMSSNQVRSSSRSSGPRSSGPRSSGSRSSGSRSSNRGGSKNSSPRNKDHN